MDTLDRLLHPHKGILRGLHNGDRDRLIPIKVEELLNIKERLMELRELREKVKSCKCSKAELNS